MKKTIKTTAVILAAAMSVFTALSLAACGDEEQPFDFDTFKSERVADAQAWNAAFDLKDELYAKYTIDVSTSLAGVSQGDSYVELIFDGNTVHGKMGDEEFSQEVDETISIMGMLQSETWTGGGNIIAYSVDSFDSFEYDEEKGAYVRYLRKDDTEPFNESFVSVKIKNGKYCGCDWWIVFEPTGSDIVRNSIRNRLYLGKQYTI